MDKVQEVQSKQYEFPYHYLPEVLSDSFRQGRGWSFTLSYVVAMKLIEQRLARQKPHNHLDIGCGDGALIHHLNRKFPDILFSGVDYDERSIEWAKLFNKGKAEFRSMDITSEPLDENFQSASLVEVIEHIPPDQLLDFIKGVQSTLADDGLLLVTVPHVNKRLFDKHYQHFSFESLREVLEPDFTIEEMFGFEFSSRFERLIRRFTIRKDFFLDSAWINKMRLKTQMSGIGDKTGEEGVGRIFCVCRARGK